ncbi:gliding motility lipoprotein GldH [Tenacibaculum sp. S7007]|uniref:Gliding motility lipoprotein GldH n=1 Tax=Tenacibaculum pelagium TaxID=2759527 RepID=A0A839AP29_9FLAO|nr:gliding motility lipoprotein GldH [Tenacibaculum pelagium]MBA6156256.1 gliding motility lipoprotein GldH [Tenacibaculum pelagium]
MKSNIVFVLFAVVFIITSCDSKRTYDEYISLPNSSWSKENTVEFSFPVKDSINKKNLFINLRNNKDYQYSNLFLITEMDFPDGQVIVDTLEYDMADVNGKFLGKGFSDIKENKLFYKENITFPTTGEYTFKVRQAMRKNGNTKGIEELEGITHVGFRIEKIE